nr:hypothetical protein BaRGS_004294 [Batillaria attramentaria]
MAACGGHDLQYRDTIILCDTPRDDLPVVIRLRARGVPVQVVTSDDDEAAIRNVALSTGNQVTVTDGRTVSGLERRIVVVFGSEYENFNVVVFSETTNSRDTKLGMLIDNQKTFQNGGQLRGDSDVILVVPEDAIQPHEEVVIAGAGMLNKEEDKRLVAHNIAGASQLSGISFGARVVLGDEEKETWDTVKRDGKCQIAESREDTQYRRSLQKHAYFHSEDSLPSLAPLRIPLGSKLVKDDIVRDLVFENTETI